MLQYVAVSSSIFPALSCASTCAYAHVNVAVCVAACCSTLQRVALSFLHYHVLPHMYMHMCMLQCVLQCVGTLQCFAVCCSVLQRVAVCCSVFQRAARAITRSPQCMNHVTHVYELCVAAKVLTSVCT